MRHVCILCQPPGSARSRLDTENPGGLLSSDRTGGPYGRHGRDAECLLSACQLISDAGARADTAAATMSVVSGPRNQTPRPRWIPPSGPSPFGAPPDSANSGGGRSPSGRRTAAGQEPGCGRVFAAATVPPTMSAKARAVGERPLLEAVEPARAERLDRLADIGRRVAARRGHSVRSARLGDRTASPQRKAWRTPRRVPQDEPRRGADRAPCAAGS